MDILLCASRNYRRIQNRSKKVSTLDSVICNHTVCGKLRREFSPWKIFCSIHGDVDVIDGNFACLQAALLLVSRIGNNTFNCFDGGVSILIAGVICVHAHRLHVYIFSWLKLSHLWSVFVICEIYYRNCILGVVQPITLSYSITTTHVLLGKLIHTRLYN